VRFRIAAVAISVAVSSQADAQAQPKPKGQPPVPLQVACRNYPESARPQLRPKVEAVRQIEREAADRLRGLDTRTFPFLAGELRKAADLIADAKVVEEEAVGVAKCQNPVAPVRAVCRGAALALATAIDEQEKEAATKASRQAYGEAMARCEPLIGLQPLSTAWRTPG
jgi:hypothetical protein